MQKDTKQKLRFFKRSLDFVPVQRKINEHELRSDSEEFCRWVRTKWHECTPDFSNLSNIKSKSKWSRPKGHPAIEIF